MDLHCKILDAPLPSWSIFLRFHAVSGEIWPSNRLVPPFGVGAPCLGNPGSAAGQDWDLLSPILLVLVHVHASDPVPLSMNTSLKCLISVVSDRGETGGVQRRL